MPASPPSPPLPMLLLLLLLQLSVHAMAMAATFPTSPKAVATKISQAVQVSLQDRKQRLQISTPQALCFGIGGKQTGLQILGDPNASPGSGVRQRADRELAYLVLEMFQAYKDATVCVMKDAKAAKLARKEWAKLPLNPADVRADVPTSKSRGVGFGSSGLSGAPKVVIVSRPSVQTVASLEPLSEELGTEAVIVLLNPEMKEPGEAAPGYECIYCLEENPHPDWAGGLIHYAYGEQWLLGTSNKKGEPVVHGRSPTRPTLDDIALGFARIETDTNWFSGKGAAAALRRRGVAAEPASV